MEKGDLWTLITIVIILALLTLLVLNIDKIFVTPTVQETIRAINAT